MEIKGSFAVFIVRLMHTLELIHVPAWDNTQCPIISSKPEKKPEAKKSAGNIPVPEVFNYGRAEPGEAQKTVSLFVSKSTEEGANAAWDYSRFDGTDGGIDFRAWDETDNEVIQEKGWGTDSRLKAYTTVRAFVIAGKTNREIAEECEKSIKWAELYAAGVREAFRRREKRQNHSPIEVI